MFLERGRGETKVLGLAGVDCWVTLGTRARRRGERRRRRSRLAINKLGRAKGRQGPVPVSNRLLIMVPYRHLPRHLPAPAPPASPSSPSSEHAPSQTWTVYASAVLDIFSKN